MNAGHYTIKSFFTFQNFEQVLIPEIQRDYVWKAENITKLLQSVMDDFTTQSATDTALGDEYLKTLPADIRDEVIRAREKKKVISNIGFIYAYFDESQFTKYMLIDGQQRITSIFLILLALHIKEGKQSQFKKTYFPEGRPKVDYKVRENAHIFLLELLEFLLEGGNIADVKEQYWFYRIYENDETINALIANYEAVASFLKTNNLSADYMENWVEFWYFDAAKSEQGEDLYLYMNSRGESVQTNENIKANLLESRSDADKHKWGSEWEEWQNTFWLNRGKSPNADRGFDGFLKWIKVINLIKDQNFSKSVDLSETVREIIESRKFNTSGLSLEIIDSYYGALIRLLKINLGRYFDNTFISEEPASLLYIRILPTLMYAEHYPEATQTELTRFCRFFFNITRFDNISKSPFRYIGQVIQLTNDFLNNGFTDVADLIEFKTEGSYDNVLTEEEHRKLFIYKYHDTSVSREELEDLFWTAEDYTLCDGRISLIWFCMDFKPELVPGVSIDKNQFYTYFNTFSSLFNAHTDLLRRALLTKGDYSIHVGYSTTLQSDRWSFGSGNRGWIAILDSDGNNKILKLLLDDFIKRANRVKSYSEQEILNAIVLDYLENDKETSWLHYFILNKKILEYCTKKLICYKDDSFDNIFLLEGQLAVENNYVSLSKFLKIKQALQ